MENLKAKPAPELNSVIDGYQYKLDLLDKRINHKISSQTERQAQNQTYFELIDRVQTISQNPDLSESEKLLAQDNLRAIQDFLKNKIEGRKDKQNLKSFLEQGRQEFQQELTDFVNQVKQRQMQEAKSIIDICTNIQTQPYYENLLIKNTPAFILKIQNFANAQWQKAYFKLEFNQKVSIQELNQIINAEIASQSQSDLPSDADLKKDIYPYVSAPSDKLNTEEYAKNSYQEQKQQIIAHLQNTLNTINSPQFSRNNPKLKDNMLLSTSIMQKIKKISGYKSPEPNEAKQIAQEKNMNRCNYFIDKMAPIAQEVGAILSIK